MLSLKNKNIIIGVSWFFSIWIALVSDYATASDINQTNTSNFGLPGIIDLPTAKQFSDGKLIVTRQQHKSLARTGISFQALPRVGVAFRYSGHGRNGDYAFGRINYDRSFDAHILVTEETKFFPAISIGLRDFIGTGWYSSEYIVGTKSLRNLEITGGLGFGRLVGKNSFSNPLSLLSSSLEQRGLKKIGRGGTLGSINWFHGEVSGFYGFNYNLGEKTTLSLEYTPDLMWRERGYLDRRSPWNLGASYQLNNYIRLSGQYLYGSQASISAHILINPSQPPLAGGKELAPVPMRRRDEKAAPIRQSKEDTIRRVLAVDRFEIHRLYIGTNVVILDVTNNKFRSTAQALGRLASTLQRFTSDDVNLAKISFYSEEMQTSTFEVDLKKITQQQFNPAESYREHPSITAIDQKASSVTENKNRFTWSLGPYFAHRLFNPNLPLSMETGIEAVGGYRLAKGLKLSGALRKSVLTNLTDNHRLSNSALPHVHSDWPLYDFAGQSGHIDNLKLSYFTNLAPAIYGRAHVGLLEPFYAGLGGEILYKPAQSPFAFGVDIHWVKKRDYGMRFDLRDYETSLGHFSVYYDAGGMFDIEVNAGRYLAGDWGATTTISRKFGSGWEVGGYATLTDVPFETFGEGSFDKAIYVSIPIDWIISSPTRTRRRLTLRPITRDGGAQLSSARNLYRQIERFQNADFQREFGRLWK